MNIEIAPVPIGDKAVLRRLLELYHYDYSEYDGADLDAHGLYGYEYLDHYWTEPGRHPFLIRVAGQLAGLALVRCIETPDAGVVHTIAEFFVLRKYRQQGIGREAAWQLFDRFPGPWRVCQETPNLPAQRFWRQVIAEYTQSAYTEEHFDTEAWRGPCQNFESRKAGSGSSA